METFPLHDIVRASPTSAASQKRAMRWRWAVSAASADAGTTSELLAIFHDFNLEVFGIGRGGPAVETPNSPSAYDRRRSEAFAIVFDLD